MAVLRYPVLTPRLALRPFRAADVDALTGYYGLEDVVRYLPFGVRDGEVLRRAVERKVGEDELRAEGDVLSLVLERRDTGAVVGDVVVKWRSEVHRQGEIGYVIDPRHGGQGFGIEAAGALLRLAFTDLGLHRVTARCDRRNIASIRVCERLGMRREAWFREVEQDDEGWVDLVVYALLEQEWRAADTAS